MPDESALLIIGAEVLAFAIDLETEADAEETDFLTADVAAEALLLSLLAVNSFKSLDPAVLEALVPCVCAGAAQLWSAGNLCGGQNCSLHCYEPAMIKVQLLNKSKIKTHRALDRGKQNFLAVAFRTNRGRLGLRSASHHRALCCQVNVHPDVGVLAKRYSDRGIA